MQMQGQAFIETDEQKFALPLNGADAESGHVFQMADLGIQDDQILHDGAHDRPF